MTKDEWITALQEELQSILHYWMHYAVDHRYGGFAGKIDHADTVYPLAPKGVVLNTRILWSFSAAYRLTGNGAYLLYADRAFRYLCDHFLDQQYGGVYWTVDYQGRPLDTKKQVYAQAFAIYAFTEYYKSCRQESALQLAVGLYRLIEQHSFDTNRTGYFEAFDRTWKPLADMRLSEKDANEQKTLNTHLHVMEAYSNLFRIFPDRQLGQSLRMLLHNFLHDFINPGTGHLNLFFGQDWQLKSSLVSFGHDIEAAWLLPEAALALQDDLLLAACNRSAIQLAEASIPAVDADGGLWYEWSPPEGWVKEKHWWPQAEAMVGFFNAWEISGKEKYLRYAINSWTFIKKYLVDGQTGEWLWGIDAGYAVMLHEDKAGLWKCPYHNSRACIEMIKRLENITTLP